MGDCIGHIPLDGAGKLGIIDERGRFGESTELGKTAADEVEESGSGVEVEGVGVGVEVVVGVGSGVEVVDGVSLVVLELELVGTATVVGGAPCPPPCPPSFSKTTKFAFFPLGTVTTQKLPPPAPEAWPPIISLTLLTAGSILHGKPLQPAPSHSIEMP